MNGRYQRRQEGQSLPLLAAMIIVIVAMVGLSVDVGNAYGQQRRVQNVTNGAALAGMNSVVANQSNKDVCTNVQRTMAANRVGTDAPEFAYRVDYVYANKSVQMLCNWNGSTLQFAPELNMNASRPKNIVRLQVTMTETVDTYFARIVGRNTLTVNANGNGCLGNYGNGVYPLGVPVNLDKTLHTISRSNGTVWPTDNNQWGQWDQMMGAQIRLPIANQNSNPGTHVPWLDWTPGSSNGQELDAGMTFPGTLQNGFQEATSPDPSRPNTEPLGKLGENDWVENKPGVNAQLADELDRLIKIPDSNPAEARDLILPMFSDAVGGGSNNKYYIQRMGHFRVISYNFGGGGAGNAYITLQYLGEASAPPEECASESPDITTKPKQFNISGVTKFTRVWRTNASTNMTYDIVVVMDTSGSMSFDWNDRRKCGDWDPCNTDYTYPRLDDAKKAVVDFVRGYDIADDPDARIAFVTFGGTGGNAAKLQQNWASACNNPSTGCGGSANQWQSIQNKANAMTPSGRTPGPIAWEMVEDLLKNKRSAPAGKQYGQIVLFATDGVFNVCGKDKGQEKCTYGDEVPCPSGDQEYCANNPSYNMVSGRPVWQGQQVAARIKAAGVRSFVVALTPTCVTGGAEYCFDPAGLPEMSSGTGYYYAANDAAALGSIYNKIREKIDADTCVPQEKLEDADSAQMVLEQPGNPNFIKTLGAGSDGSWNFTGLEAGEYTVRVSPVYSVKSPEDQLKRDYVRLRNGFNLSEETKASIYINPQYPNGSTVYSQVLLSLPKDNNGTPKNGCSPVTQ